MEMSELEREYREKYRPLYETLSGRVAELMTRLLEDADISIAQIEHRAKPLPSFLAKIERKSYKDPFSEMTDLAGIRVITYYNVDVDKVAQLIKQEFEVNPKHSSDKIQELNVDEFGYRSFHLVCTLKKPRIDLPEWKPIRKLSFEIQVRSVLQHAWAAISHKLDYKTASQAPQEVRRKLFRLSALLELADDEFASIRDRTETITKAYQENVNRGDLAIPLNLDSLREYLSERIDTNKWGQLAIEAGMRPLNEETIKIAQQVEENAARRLFETLQGLQIAHIAELDSLIKKHETEAKVILAKVAEASEKHGYRMYAVPFDALNVFLAVAEKDKFPRNYKWSVKWTDELQATLEELTGATPNK
jgi:ppGpp synthetase/RelA/SpoT-type nucleotidyltranferase